MSSQGCGIASILFMIFLHSFKFLLFLKTYQPLCFLCLHFIFSLSYTHECVSFHLPFTEKCSYFHTILHTAEMLQIFVLFFLFHHNSLVIRCIFFLNTIYFSSTHNLIITSNQVQIYDEYVCDRKLYFTCFFCVYKYVCRFMFKQRKSEQNCMYEVVIIVEVMTMMIIKKNELHMYEKVHCSICVFETV